MPKFLRTGFPKFSPRPRPDGFHGSSCYFQLNQAWETLIGTSNNFR